MVRNLYSISFCLLGPVSKLSEEDERKEARSLSGGSSDSEDDDQDAESLSGGSSDSKGDDQDAEFLSGASSDSEDDDPLKDDFLGGSDNEEGKILPIWNCNILIILRSNLHAFVEIFYYVIV